MNRTHRFAVTWRSAPGMAAAALLLFSSGVQAGGPLAVCESGVPFVWPDGGVGIPFNPDQGNLGPVSHDDAVALVQSAFDVWGAVPTATPTFVNSGELPVDVDISNFADYLSAPAPDGLSAVVFDDTGEIFDLLYGPDSGVLGFAGPEWIDYSTCTVLEGFCFLNGPAFADLTEALDVMVHEFGHYAGLAHTVVNGQTHPAFGDTSGPTPFNTFGTPDFGTDPLPDIVETLYPFYYGAGIGTSTLEADDVASLSTLYPEPGYFESTGSIRGTIFAPNGIAKLTGVNVIARNIADPFKDAVSSISGDISLTFVPDDPLTGVYTLNGLTPGAEYAVFVDQILAGGFSTPPISLPGPEEFYNGANESRSSTTDDPSEYTTISPVAGTPTTDVNIILNRYDPGTPLPLADDGSYPVYLPFPFTICQETFDIVWINANGNVTFGQADGSFLPSTPGLLDGPPRVAGLWTDLDPTAGGTVTYSETPDVVCVIWENVPEFHLPDDPEWGEVSMKIKLYRTGNRVDVEYGAVSAAGGIAGLSCGFCAASGSETPTDLSPAVARRSRLGLLRQAAVFEVFDGVGRPFDLAGKTALYQATVNYNDNWAGANNTLANAKPVALPFTSAPMARYTEIEPVGGDVDYFRFHVEAGHRVTAETVRGCFDSVLGLFSAGGELLAVDDDGGVDLLSRLRFTVPESGDYVLAVSAYPDFGFTGAGGSGGRYVLDIQTAFCPGPGSLEPSPENWLVNGSFETGDFTGWAAVDTGVPFTPWSVTDDSGAGYFGPIVPQDGCYAASNGFDGEGPMQSFLFQFVSIPSDAASATLEWKDHLIWDLFNFGAVEDRTYAVFILDADGFVLDVPFLLPAEAGTTADTGWMSHAWDMTPYVGQTVIIAFVQDIPEASTGPGQYELDGVKVRSQ